MIIRIQPDTVFMSSAVRLFGVQVRNQHISGVNKFRGCTIGQSLLYMFAPCGYDCYALVQLRTRIQRYRRLLSLQGVENLRKCQALNNFAAVQSRFAQTNIRQSSFVLFSYFVVKIVYTVSTCKKCWWKDKGAQLNRHESKFWKPF